MITNRKGIYAFLLAEILAKTSPFNFLKL
jgi:hypothetical protein